ncbi:hypothetical protein [Pollutibacter soli]|uniref:hypothetical protein n=1 Tax=Pollutibacter soli TaxID=3034157 RepID=UPI00301413B9
MKKWMFVLGLMGIVSFSFAGESRTGAEGDAKKAFTKKHKNDQNDKSVKTNDFKICTVSQTAKVSIYVVEYTVTCSATAESCEAAATEALTCVTSAVRALKKTITSAS